MDVPLKAVNVVQSETKSLFSSQNHNFNQKLTLKSEVIRFWENKDILQIKTFFSNKTNKY